MLDKAKLVGESSGQVKTDCKKSDFFYGLFLARKIKFCLTIDWVGIFEEHETLRFLQIHKD